MDDMATRHGPLEHDPAIPRPERATDHGDEDETCTDPGGTDREGGDAPCWAHLLGSNPVTTIFP